MPKLGKRPRTWIIFMESILTQLMFMVKALESDKRHEHSDIVIRVGKIDVFNISRNQDVYTLIGVNDLGEHSIMFCERFVPTIVIRPKAEEHRRICGFDKNCQIDQDEPKPEEKEEENK